MTNFKLKHFKDQLTKLVCFLVISLFILNSAFSPGILMAQEEAVDSTEAPLSEEPAEEQPLEQTSDSSGEPTGQEQGSETNTEEENTLGEQGDEGATDGETLIDTGDAGVVIDAENDINQNSYTETSEQENTESETAEPSADAPIEDSGTDLAEAMPVESGTDTDGEDPADPAEITVTNTNDAELDNGISGEGATGDNMIPGSDGAAIIDTGDANVDSLLDNDVNENFTDPVCESDCGASTTASTTHTIKTENDNNASTTNEVALSGSSGANTIEESADSAIETGDVGIISIVINYINNNFFGSGKEFFIDVFNHVLDNIDLSGYYDDPVGGESACETMNCEVTVNNDNTATIDNAIVIDANTGENLIASSSGASRIKTGDIDIVSDVLNIANLNVTGDGWFFAVVNIFGMLEGDVILPGVDEVAAPESADELYDKTAANIDNSSQLIVTNKNLGEVLNNIDINASSGENAIASSGEAVIMTGDVNVESNVFNLINYNITGNSWKFAKVNVFGDWQGFIHGLPEGYGYYEDGNGITIYNEFLNDPAFYSAYAQLVVENRNAATTTNDIVINANSGDNSILHGSSGGTIETGDVNVESNVMNWINSNFTGNDWEFSMINVFGEWQGNLAFGQPDLWVKESVSTRGPVEKGGFITYNFLFGNSGDGLASGVQLFDDYDEALVEAGDDTDGVGMLWNMDYLPPNTQGSLSYTVQVREDIPHGEHTAKNTASIFSRENDRDHSNNTVNGSVLLDGGRQPASGGSSGGSGGYGNLSFGRTSLPSFAVVKTNDADDVLRPGDVVNFKVVIKNTGSAIAKETLVYDIMSNFGTKKVVNSQLWNLETVYEGEEIIIEYTLEIKNNIETGTYINEVVVEGYDVYRDLYVTGVASTKIKVENNDFQDIPLLLEINNVSDAFMANPGEVVQQKLLVTNNSLVTAFDVKVIEGLPSGLTYTDEDGKINKTWELGNIKPGFSKTIEYEVLVSHEANAGDYKKIQELSAKNLKTRVVEDILRVETVNVLGSEIALENEFLPKETAISNNAHGDTAGDTDNIKTSPFYRDALGPYPNIQVVNSKPLNKPELDRSFNAGPLASAAALGAVNNRSNSDDRITLWPGRYMFILFVLILALFSLLMAISSLRKIINND